MSRALVILGTLAMAVLPGCSCGSTEPDAASIDAGSETFFDAELDTGLFPDGGTPDSGKIDDACERAELEGNVLGCRYVAFSSSRAGFLKGGCFAVILVNSGDLPARIDVMWQGASADLGNSALLLKNEGAALEFEPIGPDGTIPPHRTAAVSLAGNENACPSPPIQWLDKVGIDPLPNSTAHTFWIQTSRPTLAYQVWPYYTPAIEQDFAQLRAVPSWTTSYIDVGTYRPHTSDATVPAYPWTAMVASVDGTSFAVPSSDAGVIIATLMQDQVLSVVRDDLFIGKTIETDRPFGFWTGSAGFSIPFDGNAGNAVELPVPSVAEWGHTIPFARQDNRFDSIDERTVLRIVAAKDGTVLTYSPSKPAGAPDALDAGGWAVFDAWTPFAVQSQDDAHPIFLAAHMISSSDIIDDAVAGGRRGANTLMAVPALESFGNRYDFFTLANHPITELVITRAQGSADVVLDCAGPIDGWQNIDGSFEFARVWLSRQTNNDFTPQVYPGGICDNGTHAVQSSDPFGVMVYSWGYHSYDSPSSKFSETAYTYAPIAAHATKTPPPEKDGGAPN